MSIDEPSTAMRRVAWGFSLVIGSSCMPKALVDKRLAEEDPLYQRLELKLKKVAVEIMNDIGILEGDPAAGLADQPLRCSVACVFGAMPPAD